MCTIDQFTTKPVKLTGGLRVRLTREERRMIKQINTARKRAKNQERNENIQAVLATFVVISIAMLCAYCLILATIVNGG